jgi:hypothetical protein
VPEIELKFSLLAWSFWDGSGDKPEVPQVPAILRRRASLAARMALKAAFECLPSAEERLPTVFCSRHGEVGRSVELMEMMARGEGQLPMSFSLSVHNAAAGLYSIARGDTSNSVTLAAGKNTLPMGVAEACGLLSQGHPRVLLVNFDDAVPAPFKGFRDEADPPFALGLLLGQGSAFSLESSGAAAAPSALLEQPQAPLLADFLKGSQPSLQMGPWVWRRL